MLLPQTDAFHTLVDRLKSVPNPMCTPTHVGDLPGSVSGLEEEKLLKIFAENRSCHTKAPPETGVSLPWDQGLYHRHHHHSLHQRYP